MTTKKRKLKPGLRRNKKNNNNKWQRSREKGFSAGSQCFGWANVLHRQAGVNMAAELIFLGVVGCFGVRLEFIAGMLYI